MPAYVASLRYWCCWICLHVFRKHQHLIKKGQHVLKKGQHVSAYMPIMFSVHYSITKPIFFLLHLSFHLIKNTQSIKRLKLEPLPLTPVSTVSVSAILSCRPFFILIFLPCIKMNHYGFSRKSIWINLETFPWSIESRLQLFFSRWLPRSAYHFWRYEFLDVQTGL